MTKWVTETELKRAVADGKRAERKKRQKVEQDNVVLRRERKQYKLEAARQRNSSRAFEAKASRLEKERARERAMWSTHKEGVPDWEMGDAPADPNAIHAHAREVLDAILRDEDATRGASGLAAEKFAFLLQRFKARANRAVGGKSPPLFYGAKGRGSKPGARMLLTIRHLLLMALAYKSEGPSQYFLRTVFAISRPTTSRCLAFADDILAVILPTADRVTHKLAHAETLKEFKQLVPGQGLGILIIDGTHTERQRPKDKEERDASYGGKFKMYSYTTLVCSNRYGGILWLGKTLHGSINDKGALHKNEPSFGKWTAKLHDKNVGPKWRFTLIYDLGFPGVEGEHPGQRVLLGIKRRPKQDLSKEEVEWNKYVGSRRAYVEHGIGECKRFELIKHPFRGSNEKYRRQLNIISGLANLNRFWPIIRRDAWIGRKL